MPDEEVRPQRPALLHAVTDRRRLALSERTLLERIAWLAEAGVDAIQIRERDLDARHLSMLVREAVRLTTGARTRIFVNDRADVAVACAAGGVHLREDSIAAARVRT